VPRRRPTVVRRHLRRVRRRLGARVHRPPLDSARTAQIHPALSQKTPYQSTDAVLLKIPSAFYISQDGPSTFNNHFIQVLSFMFRPLSLLVLAPEVLVRLFYVLNLLFLHIISYRSSVFC
jgi:hypothetical protein